MLKKTAAMFRKTVKIHFREMYSDWNFTEICSCESGWQTIGTGLGNGMASSRRQAISWTIDNPVYFRMYLCQVSRICFHIKTPIHDLKPIWHNFKVCRGINQSRFVMLSSYQAAVLICLGMCTYIAIHIFAANKDNFMYSDIKFYSSLNKGQIEFLLIHWGRVPYICVGIITIIGSDNGLSPDRPQAIIWTNAGILLNGPLGTNFSEISIEIHIFSFKKMDLKWSFAKWRPFCLGLNVLTELSPSWL